MSVSQLFYSLWLNFKLWPGYTFAATLCQWIWFSRVPVLFPNFPPSRRCLGSEICIWVWGHSTRRKDMWSRQTWALLSEYFTMAMSGETTLSTQGEPRHPVHKSEMEEEDEIFTRSSVEMLATDAGPLDWRVKAIGGEAGSIGTRNYHDDWPTDHDDWPSSAKTCICKIWSLMLIDREW